jgi:hypothetical protein
VQDEFAGYIWCRLLQAKSELPEEMYKLLSSITKVFNITIKNIRFDNSGENEAFKRLMDESKDFNINFEFTAPHTPEMNGKLERKFVALYGKARSMLSGAKIPKYLRIGLLAQCAKTASQLENIFFK